MRIPPQLKKNHVVPPSSKDEALARNSVSREVPRSVLKSEKLLGTLDATPKFPNILVSLQGNTEVPSVSREVPGSALKCETVLAPLMRPQKFLDTPV